MSQNLPYVHFRPKVITYSARMFIIAYLGATSFAAELVETKVADSPNGQKRLEAKLWNVNGIARIEVELTANGKTLLKIAFAPEIEARYAKIAWSPQSDAALISANYKSGEDWILIGVPKSKVTYTYFHGDQSVNKRLLATLPFREDIKSVAPVGRVPWNSVQWNDRKQCEMKFIYSGIGYQGTARLLIDFKEKKPTLRVVSITPKVDPALWNQE